VQTKSPFMNVHRLVRWADWMLGLLPAGRAKAGSVVAKLRACLDELPACRTLIRQFRDDAVALLACQKMLNTHGLTRDTLHACEPLLDPMGSVRVRQEFSRYLHHQLETAKQLGLDDVGLPISSDPIESLFGLSKQHGADPLKDANRMALRIPALCGLPTQEEAQHVLTVTVTQQLALTKGVASLTKQRRQIRANPPHLEQLGDGGNQGNVEFIPPGKAPSERPDIIDFPNGYKAINGPSSQDHEVSTTKEMGAHHQVQNPVKSLTPI
jgi:hypothetical protein